MIFQPTIDASKLASGLQTQRIGRTIRSLAEAASTNDICWEELAQTGSATDGFVVLADYQTAGRGRFARTWLAPRASSLLLSTLILQPREPLLVERLSLVAGIAACLAARQVSAGEIQLRWPNDLVCQRKKIGGVLVESRQFRPGADLPQSKRSQSGRIAVVIGIGINCLQHAGHFPPELRQKAASLDMVSTRPISRFDLGVSLIRQLDAHLGAPSLPDAEAVRVTWQHLAEPLGQRVCLIHAGQRLYGTTVELDPTGGLLVQLESGGRRIFQPPTTTMEVVN